MNRRKRVISDARRSASRSPSTSPGTSPCQQPQDQASTGPARLGFAGRPDHGAHSFVAASGPAVALSGASASVRTSGAVARDRACSKRLRLIGSSNACMASTGQRLAQRDQHVERAAAELDDVLAIQQLPLCRQHRVVVEAVGVGGVHAGHRKSGMSAVHGARCTAHGGGSRRIQVASEGGALTHRADPSAFRMRGRHEPPCICNSSHPFRRAIPGALGQAGPMRSPCSGQGSSRRATYEDAADVAWRWLWQGARQPDT